MRERRKPLLWRVICERLNMHNTNGSPATGLADKIGYGTKQKGTNVYKPYEPGREVRARLGLRDQCSTCRRPFRKAGQVREKIAITEARKLFNKFPRARQDEILAWALAQIGEL